VSSWKFAHEFGFCFLATDSLLLLFLRIRVISSELSKLSYLDPMAPPLLETQPTAPHELSDPSHKTVNRKIFPDGIKTSGQHPPIYHALRPYSDFPKEITGTTVWKAEDYTNNLERWVHEFSEEEIKELSVVADKFLADGIPLTGISQVSIQPATSIVSRLRPVG
jgi:hypothetical protein